MKRYILLLLIIIELTLIKIPNYVELNNLAIITDISVINANNTYTLILKEQIPIKDNNSITYKYKYYKKTANSIDASYNYLKKTIKKKLYINKVKSLTTNMTFSKEIIEKLNINPSTIIHTNNTKYLKLNSN